MNEIIRKTIEIAKDRDFEKALKFQRELASQLIIFGIPKTSLVLGFDAAYVALSEGEFSISMCVVFEKNGSSFLQREFFYSIDKVWFPYVFGLFAFREGIGFIRCWEKIPESIRKAVDLIMVDGHGIFHPRGVGLASHIGLMTGVPTIGCAKDGPRENVILPDREVGSYSFLYTNGKEAGIILRTRQDTRPLWVSPGHLVGIDALRDIVLGFIDGYRIPIPIRSAHILAKKLKKEFIS